MGIEKTANLYHSIRMMDGEDWSERRIITYEMIDHHLSEIARMSLPPHEGERFRWMRIVTSDAKKKTIKPSEDTSILNIIELRDLPNDTTPLENALIVCAPEQESAIRKALADTYAIAITDRSLHEVAYAVQELFASICLWNSDLMQMAQNASNLSDFFQKGVQIMGGFACMTDFDFSLVVSASNESSTSLNPRNKSLLECGRYDEEWHRSIEWAASRSVGQMQNKIVVESDEDGFTLHQVIIMNGNPRFHVSFQPPSDMGIYCAMDLFTIFFTHLKSLCINESQIRQLSGPKQTVLSMLIEDRAIGELSLEEALRGSEIWRAKGYTVCVLKISELENPYHRNRVIEEVKRINDGNNISFIHDDELVVISYSNLTHFWSELGMSSFDKIDDTYFKQIGLRVGASGILNDIKSIGIGYRQAMIALTYYDAIVNESLMSGGFGWILVCPFTWALPYYLTAGNHVDRVLVDSAFLDSPAMQLYREDKETGSNQIQVIWTYLCNGGNVAATSKALFMHRNTVNYHVRKYSERFGVNLSIVQIRNATILDFQRMFAHTKTLKDALIDHT